jgi:hypothetical protein
VASPKSGPWWILWIQISLWLVLAPKVFQLCTNRLVVWFVQVCVSDWMLVILPNFILELQHALLPPKCYEPRSVHPIPCPFVILTSDSHLNLSRSLGVCHHWYVPWHVCYPQWTCTFLNCSHGFLQSLIYPFSFVIYWYNLINSWSFVIWFWCKLGWDISIFQCLLVQHA